jgi:hypothetical protein
MSHTLVVVDMQRKFPSANKRSLIQNVANEIISTIQQRGTILFVEFIGFGPTHQKLVALTDNYEKTFLVRKARDDGHDEVIKCLRDNDLPMGKIKGVGVNTNQCVWYTLSRLMKEHLPLSQLEIVRKACNSYSLPAHKEGLRYFSEAKNVTLI